MQTLSPEAVAAVLSGSLSLAFTLIPGLNAKFAALESEVKTAIMGGLSALIAIGIYVIACTPALAAGFPFACPEGGFWGLVVTVFLSVTVNQGVYKGTPKPAAVINARKSAG